MTVRTWFRLQRAALWAQDNRTASDIDSLTEKVIRQDPLDCVEDCWPFKLIMCDARGYAAHTRAFELVRDRLHRAMYEMERELQRRASLERYARDITE